MDAQTHGHWQRLMSNRILRMAGGIINHMTNGPVKAHLTSEQILSTKPEGFLSTSFYFDISTMFGQSQGLSWKI